MDNWLVEKENGLLLKVKAQPNSSKNQISILDDHLKIRVTAPAIENKANQEILKYLAKILNIKKASLELVSGNKSKFKHIFIYDDKIEEIKSKINEVAV